MPASIRATTTIEGNTVTLNLAGMTVGPPPPPPPPFKIALTRRGAVLTIKKGKVDITIELPADAGKPVVVDARGNAVCRGPGVASSKAGVAKKPKAPAARKRTTKRAPLRAAEMTPPPPPDQK